MSFLDGYHLVVKRDCPTCTLIEPVVRAFAETLNSGLSIYVQDDPNYLCDLNQTCDDTALEKSFLLDVETVPTLIRYESGVEAERAVGWVRQEWCEEKFCLLVTISILLQIIYTAKHPKRISRYLQQYYLT